MLNRRDTVSVVPLSVFFTPNQGEPEMLTQEKLTRRQKEYLRRHLAQTKGILGELTAKKNLLREKCPCRQRCVDPQLCLEVKHLQEVITTLLFDVEFIEKWSHLMH